MQILALSFVLLVFLGFSGDFARSGTPICISAGTPNAAQETAELLRERFSYVHLTFLAPMSHSRRRSVSVSGADMRLLRGLISRGRIILRFVPRGPEYQSAKPFASASLSFDNFGNRVILFTVADARAFYGFTRRNVGKRLGFFVDGHLVSAPYIQEPIGRDGEVAVLHGTDRLGILAAIMNSGPIPENVTVSVDDSHSLCK